MSKNTVTLELTEDELVQIVGTLRPKLAGSTRARTTVQRKLDDAFFDMFGVTAEKILAWGSGSTNWVQSDVLQSQLDTWRTNRAVAEENAQTFTYHGFERVVKDVKIDGARGLLSGFELYRDGRVTNQFKYYKLNEIG